jgi:DNA-directed RNA polymerase specialized sigma24 family protein
LGSRRRRRDGYVELWHRVGADATRLAFLLDPEPEAARDTARRAFSRCITRMQDRRSADLIDVWFRRDVVRLVARRSRAAVVRRALNRRRPEVEELRGQSADRRELWHALMLLPVKQRAAIVLDVFEHMPRARAADALGRSVAGTSALLARGWAGLEARLGSRPEASELEKLLAAATEHFEAARAEPVEIRKLGRRARTVSAVVAICLVGGAAGGTIVASSALSTAQREAEGSRISGDDEDDSSTEGGSDIGLGFRGSPRWCPDPRRALTIDTETGTDATRAAIRVAISIVKGYTNRLEHLIEVPAGAPPPRQWPAPAGAGRLSIVARGFGGLNDSLTINCGVQVADRTWIAIIEDREPPWDDAVAFYVVRRPTGFKVWGSYGALGR